MLTPEEFVTRKPIVKAVGEGFFSFINSLPLPKAQRLGRAFKKPDPSKGRLPPAERLLGGDVGGMGLLSMFAAGGMVGPTRVNAVARGQQWARSQAGKPYGWGMVGPGSYDCSGFRCRRRQRP